MKQCHICNEPHATIYCHVCGAFSYVSHTGERCAINRHGLPVARAIGRMSRAVSYAQKLQHNVPVSIGTLHVGK